MYGKMQHVLCPACVHIYHSPIQFSCSIVGCPHISSSTMGLRYILLRNFCPTPHVTEHSDQSNHEDKPHFPDQNKSPCKFVTAILTIVDLQINTAQPLISRYLGLSVRNLKFLIHSFLFTYSIFIS